jgi:hypothetical protein
MLGQKDDEGSIEMLSIQLKKKRIKSVESIK